MSRSSFPLFALSRLRSTDASSSSTTALLRSNVDSSSIYLLRSSPVLRSVELVPDQRADSSVGLSYLREGSFGRQAVHRRVSRLYISSSNQFEPILTFLRRVFADSPRRSSKPAPTASTKSSSNPMVSGTRVTRSTDQQLGSPLIPSPSVNQDRSQDLGRQLLSLKSRAKGRVRRSSPSAATTTTTMLEVDHLLLERPAVQLPGDRFPSRWKDLST